jgi:ferredoxin-thioredoxin reductase catalytic subunit
MSDHLTRNRERLEKIAKAKGYVLNPNKHWVDEIIYLMSNNYQEYGRYICPCKQHFPPDPEMSVICPCPTLDKEVADDGFCRCRLFFQPGFEKQRINILETITCPG